jgi:ATP-binding cassette subfamily B protein
MLKVAFEADPLRATLSIVLNIISALASVLSSVWLRDLTNAAVHHHMGDVWRAAAGEGITVAAAVFAGWTGFTLSMALREKTGALLDQRLIELTAGIPGLEHHERPDYLDKIEVLRRQRDQLASASEAIVQNIAVLVGVFTTVGLLASLHPILILLPLFGIPSIIAGAKSEQLRQKAADDTAEGMRVTRHLLELATTAGPGKELRIFGLGRHLIDRHHQVWHDTDLVQDKAQVKATLMSGSGWMVFGLGYVGAIALVAERAVQGHGDVGSVVMAITLAAQVNQQVAGAVGMMTWMLSSLKTVGRYLWLVDYAAEAARPPSHPLAAPDRMERGLDLTDVAFRYPGTEVDILHDVNLHLPAGSTVAVVGENGAGKSTFIKLLCRFYEPTSGSITADGIALSQIAPDEWRDRMSAGFQDFARLELAAGQTVGVGDLPYLDDEPVVVGALARAGADTVMPTLPQGLQTQLGKSFDDGVELSGGQWQKLALGRAMMRENPLLLVLDEPTASLDAETEYALFERYAGAARRVSNETGAITVLVSHRFSTVRMADLIVVIDGGTVAEAGSHAELLARDGLYAELFELQARAYR